MCFGCDTSYIVSVHIQCQAFIYTLSLCRGHSWRVRLAKQETLTPPGHLVSTLVCRSPWMSTVVLYCWCDSASVLLYFTLQEFSVLMAIIVSQGRKLKKCAKVKDFVFRRRRQQRRRAMIFVTANKKGDTVDHWHRSTKQYWQYTQFEYDQRKKIRMKARLFRLGR